MNNEFGKLPYALLRSWGKSELRAWCIDFVTIHDEMSINDDGKIKSMEVE